MKRQRTFFLVIIIAFCILLSRLFFLQIVRGDFFRQRSERNRIQLLSDAAPRGDICDRNGEILVGSRPSFCVSLIPWLARNNIEEVLGRLSEIIDIDIDQTKSRIRNQRFRPFLPVPLAEDISPAVASRILECQMDFQGVFIQPKPWRNYPRGNVCAHILGYIQEIGEQDLETLKDYGYDKGDYMGRAGIERAYEEDLKGIDGGTEIEVDVLGRPAQSPRILDRKEPIKGADIILTIDRQIQEICEKMLEGNVGTVTVLDPSNGEIIAMTSKPDYNPDMFTSSIPKWKWRYMLNDRRHPFINRAIQCTYPPGSVFKVVVAAAGLEKDIIGTEDTYKCEGEIDLGKRVYRCWKKKPGHGTVDLNKALAESCDVYFYQMGSRIGPRIISEYAGLFGLGNCSGIDIAGEKSGLVPNPSWKKELLGDRWFAGDSFNFSVGQGYMLSTPLQIVNMMSVFFNGGKLYQPHLLKATKKSDGEYIPFREKLIGEISLRPQTVAVIKQALTDVVAKGTGRLAFIKEAQVSGKTGTAQNSTGRDHAWFVCYASPVSGIAADGARPLVLGIFLEGGGEGGKVAAPMAGRILHEIYKKQ